MAKGYLLAPDNMSFTLFLREGMKWSDGSPFTAHDFTFKFYDMFKQDEVETWGIRSQVDEVVAVDDYTVRYDFSRPFPAFLLDMVHWRSSDWMLYSPKEYLSKWHITYNEDANTLAKEEGFENWGEAFNNHASFRPTHDIERPRVDPWMFTEQTTTIRAFVRNPFFHQVDQAGNQLPYVDKIVSELVEKETYDLKIIAGEADVAFLSATLDNYTLYKQNEEAGNYVVTLIPGVGATRRRMLQPQPPRPGTRELYNTSSFAGDAPHRPRRGSTGGVLPARTRASLVLPAPATTRLSGRGKTVMSAYDPTRPTACSTRWAWPAARTDCGRDSEGRTILLPSNIPRSSTRASHWRTSWSRSSGKTWASRCRSRKWAATSGASAGNRRIPT